ncbi:hypothetical protein TYRP_020232 [Tyrophagus putrescentiae]|nr:hypothetical protein TYRP_020232 [Tyrophagus putrescentiae]
MNRKWLWRFMVIHRGGAITRRRSTSIEVIKITSIMATSPGRCCPSTGHCCRNRKIDDHRKQLLLLQQLEDYSLNSKKRRFQLLIELLLRLRRRRKWRLCREL